MIDIEWTTYHTKGDLLRGIGKKANDNKLVDRMMWRWEVYVEDGVYHYIGSVDVKDLINEIKNLREWIKVDLGAQVEKTNKVENTLTADKDLEKKLKELESDLDFQMKEYEKLENQTKEEVWMYQECIRKCYLWAVNEKKIKITRPDFRDNVLKLKKTLPWEDNQ